MACDDGVGGGLPIQVAPKWEEPSGTLVTYPLWSEHTSMCPGPTGMPPTSSCPLTTPKVKKASREKKDQGLQVADSSVERILEGSKSIGGMRCGSLLLSQQWGCQGLVSIETTRDRNSSLGGLGIPRMPSDQLEESLHLPKRLVKVSVWVSVGV